jgi:hypothetical protein
MRTMRDEIFDREYQAGRAEFHAGIDRLIASIGRSIGDSLNALHRIEWSAPWRVTNNGRAGRA